MMEKMSMYKFTHILLLKNDSQLKQKSYKQPKIKIIQIIKKIKIMSSFKQRKIKKK